MRNSVRPGLFLVGAALFFVAFTASAALFVNPPLAITSLVTVQPIIVSDDGGGNTAEFFGNGVQQASNEGLIDIIWAQAGIDVTFLTPNSWNSTFANVGTVLPRPTIDLDTIVSDGMTAGVTNVIPSVINMFLVNIAPGFNLLSENSAAGLATVDGNGIAQYVGSNLLAFLGGREVIASVVAHEIGHNLGLDHLLEMENLMQAGGSPDPGERLNNIQITNVLDSVLVTAIPVPAAAWLLASGFLSLTVVSRHTNRGRNVRKPGCIAA